jgi:hypothetical protein
MRTRAANAALGQVIPLSALLAGAVRDERVVAAVPSTPSLAAEGAALQTTLTAVVHRERDRADVDKGALRRWAAAATSASTELARQATAEGFQGPTAELAPLVYAGVRVPGRVVGIHDTGTTVNTSLRLRVEVEVADAAGQPVSLVQTVLVARTAVPRLGEPVEVVHHPGRPDAGFAFRVV